MSVMGILAWIILGGIAGWVATKLVGKGGRGLVFNIVIGIVGAFVGGLLFEWIGAAGVTGFNLWSFVVAVVGASLLLWIARQLG